MRSEENGGARGAECRGAVQQCWRCCIGSELHVAGHHQTSRDTQASGQARCVSGF